MKIKTSSIQPPAEKDKNGNTIQPSQEELAARTAKEQVVFSGFIAQEVEAAAKTLHYDFDGVDASKNDKDMYGLRYANFVVPLVKAVQEQQDTIHQQQLTIQTQQATQQQAQSIEDLKKMIAQQQQEIDDFKALIKPKQP